MPDDILKLFGYFIVAILLVIVVAARRRSHGRYIRELAHSEVCDHLRPALDMILSRGNRIRHIGQERPDLPLEVHFELPFNPQAILDELQLTDPVFVSERNVLYCKTDWCELHPGK